MMPKFTRQQAAIISAYTGFLAGPFEDMHQLVEAKLGRPVMTHEFGSKCLSEKIRELVKDDFLALIPERGDP